MFDDDVRDTDVALNHLIDAQLELNLLGLHQAAQRVADLVDEIDHGTTEESQ